MKKEIKFRKPRTKNAYKGMIFISGYFYIYLPEHPNAMHGKRYVGLHRLVMEWKLKRFLTSEEIVHHIDGNPLNNNPYNLQVLSAKEHNKLTANNRQKDKYGKFTTDN